jgi:predicted MFS family arabinose efflux permease
MQLPICHLVIAGFILVLGENMFSGLLTMFATALEINANHFQMTYYLLILLILSVILFIVILKIKHTNHF